MTDFDELRKLQERMTRNLQQEQDMDETLNILSIINELAPYPGQSIQKEQVLVEAAQRGYSESLVLTVLEKLKKDGIIFEPQLGYIQKR